MDEGNVAAQSITYMDRSTVVHEAGAHAAVKMELEGNLSLGTELNEMSELAPYLHQETIQTFGEQRENAIKSENVPDSTLVEREIENGYSLMSEMISVKEERLEQCAESGLDPVMDEDEGDFDQTSDVESVESDRLRAFVTPGKRMDPTEGKVPGLIASKDIVTSLLEIPFSQRSDFEKHEILKRGRPTPKLTHIKKYKTHSRTFRSSWYDQHKWMCGSGVKLKLFCWPCILLGKKTSPWSTEGFDDLKNFSARLARHVSSKHHLNAHLSLNNMSKQIFKGYEVLNERDGLQKIEYNEEVKKNREILKLLIDVTSLLCKQELAFAGHNESEDSINSKHFNAIYQLVLSRQPDLRQHWENNGSRGFPNYIQNELIECFHDEVKIYVESNINQAPFFACVVDEITEVSEKTQCSILVRLVDSKGEIQEHFLGFYDNGNRTADFSCSVLCKVLEKFNIQNKLIAQTYDGASVMAGELDCLQAKVREHAPQALLTHCFTNCQSLVLQQSCSKIKAVKIFFSTLQGIRAFFHRSSKHSAVVVFKVFGKRVPTNSEVQRYFDCNIINAVHRSRLQFIEVFKEFMDSSDSAIVREAQGYLNNLENFTFVFFLSVFRHIFEKTDLLFDTLQRNTNDTQSCTSSVFECILFLRNLRDDNKYDEFIQSAESATGSSSLVLKLNELGNKYVVSSNYYKQIYLEILDDVITQLEVRFSSCEKFKFLKLGDTSSFSKYYRKFPSDALISLTETYGVRFNKEKLRTELETVFSPMHEDTFHSLSLSRLIKQMVDDGTNVSLHEAYKLFTLIAIIPASSSLIETNFSCLKRIQTFLRNCTTQYSLGALALVSIEKDLLSKLESRPTWHDDIIDRFAKRKDRRVNLLYV